VTHEIESEVVAALRTNDQPVLRKYGRFLEPISEMVRARLATTHDEAKIDQSLAALVLKPRAMCQAPTAEKTASSTKPSVQ
jgi:hypothetical protein